jgi:hypothetical protein
MPGQLNKNLPSEGFTPEFLRALTLIGEAMEEIAAAGYARPVLVGGAALEVWTAGQYLSGDFDLLTADPAPMEAALLVRGFRREDRRGHLLRGLYHPELKLGVEFVSGQLFDGSADHLRLLLVSISRLSRIQIIPVEDVIADRLGQYVAEHRRIALLNQARLAYRLATELDRAYLDRRIRHETAGELSLAEFDGLTTDEDN